MKDKTKTFFVSCKNGKKVKIITTLFGYGFFLLDARINNNPAGFAYFSIEDDNCKINNLFIHEEFRKQGIGRQLLNMIEYWARISNCSVIQGIYEPRVPFEIAKKFYTSQYDYIINETRAPKKYFNIIDTPRGASVVKILTDKNIFLPDFINTSNSIN